jgi:hypothetical protein
MVLMTDAAGFGQGDELLVMDDGKARTTTISWSEPNYKCDGVSTRERVLESTEGWQIELTMIGLICRRFAPLAVAEAMPVEVLTIAPHALLTIHTVLTDD